MQIAEQDPPPSAGMSRRILQVGALLLVAVFLGVGGLADWRHVHLRSSPRDATPEATTDAFLRILLLRHPAAALEDALRPFPPDGHLLFVGPESEVFFIQVYFTVQYLAYPRIVTAEICKAPGSPPVIRKADPSSKRLDGILLFEVPPPAGAEFTRVSSKLVVMRLANAEPWNSYCP